MYFEKIVQNLPYQSPLEVFAEFGDTVPGILFESADIAPVYGRQSLIVIDPIVEIIGQADRFQLRARTAAGRTLLEHIPQSALRGVQSLRRSAQHITGRIPRQTTLNSEDQHYQQKNISNILRLMLQQFANDDPYFGMYGAFSYDFVRLFEELPERLPSTAIPDFHLYIPDLIYTYDHLKETATLHYYKFTEQTLPERLHALPRVKRRAVRSTRRAPAKKSFQVGRVRSTLSETAYQQQVGQAQQYMKQGDIFEVVLSRQLTATFQGSPLALYQQYRSINPSPYMFYLRFPERVLLGASPEMFVRVEKNIVMTRPISGTARRGDDAMADYQAMLDLLNSAKEKSELDMLIDLARNDVARVCLPGIHVSDYRYVEKYAKVMHTIAHVSGQLDADHYLAFDALLAALNAGTLTGAPKIRAMGIIEELEPVRRGFYGGCIGYLTFNNELNTGITIRSAVIEDGRITTQVGATLLLDSVPAAEYQETAHKAAALIQAMQHHL